MEKKNSKKYTSWGVSFASLALVAGMMSYMGITDKNKTSTTNSVAQVQTSTQPSQGNNQNVLGDSANDNGTASSSGNDNSTNSNDQPSIDNGNSGQDNNQFSGSGFGHHDGFDTTTGGS